MAASLLKPKRICVVARNSWQFSHRDWAWLFLIWGMAGYWVHGIRLGVLYIAFRLNYRDGKACEQLLIHARGIDIIRISAKGAQTRQTLPSLWIEAQLIKQKGRRRILQLRLHHRAYEIGAFLPPAEEKADGNDQSAHF